MMHVRSVTNMFVNLVKINKVSYKMNRGLLYTVSITLMHNGNANINNASSKTKYAVQCCLLKEGPHCTKMVQSYMRVIYKTESFL